MGYIFARVMPRRSSKKDTPAKLAGRMKRRWRVVEILGTVEAPDVEAGKSRRSGPVRLGCIRPAKDERGMGG